MSSSSSSSSSAAAASAVRAPTKYADEQQDLCRVTIVSESCAQERNCSACLNVAVLERPASCYLDATTGICQSFSQLALTQQTLRELNGSATAPTTLEQWVALEGAGFYASTHRKYCSSLDSACQLCAKVANNAQFVPTYAQLGVMSSDRRLCHGSDGCICVTVCESAERVSYTSTRCPVPTTAEPKSSQAMMASPKLHVTIIAVLSLFLFARCASEYIRIRWARRRTERRAAGGGSGGSGGSARPVREANRLRLSGWIAWHRELREMEKNGELRYVDLETPKPRSTDIVSVLHGEADGGGGDDDVVMLDAGGTSRRTSI